MQQIARNVTMEGCGALRDCRYLLHDRATKYTQLNAYAERWVKSV
jgi:putative transposase